MPSNYIPRPDPDFDTWQKNFIDYLDVNFGNLGLKATDILAADAARAVWKVAYPDHTQKHRAARNASEAKDAARQAYEAAIRPLVRWLQASAQSVVSDTERAALGLTVRVPGGGSPQPIASRPLVTVETSQRLRHTLRFTDESSPSRRGKPKGVVGAEVWMKIEETLTPTPPSPDAMDFLTLTTRAPAVLTLTGADAGRTAYYALRWIGKGGVKGPWSETVGATVAA